MVEAVGVEIVPSVFGVSVLLNASVTVSDENVYGIAPLEADPAVDPGYSAPASQLAVAVLVPLADAGADLNVQVYAGALELAFGTDWEVPPTIEHVAPV